MADESEADVCDALQRDLDGAILRLLGEAASRFRLFRGDPVKREAVCPAGGRDRRGADLQSSVPCGTFRRMQVAAQRQGVDAPAPVRSLPGGGVRVTVVSEFGFEHQREYASGAKLGEAILQELAAPAALVANARVGKDGTLYFVSRLFMERQRGLGKLLCTVCGTFSASEKGLRHHQQIVHGTSYEESKDFAELAKHQQLATVVTNNPVVALALQQARQNAEAEAARARAARAALDPGLAAARDGDLAVLRALVSDGWDVTTPDRYGSCALQWAAGAGHLAVVRWLVEECGLDPRTTVQPKDGRNALHWASRNGKLRVCQWLVEHGRVDPSTPTKDGTSPFHWAVWQGHVGVGEWLIEIGADWRAKNSFGCNAVQWAALSGSVSMCRWLQSVGLEIDLLNDNGHSALHKAAVKGQQSVCTWLLSPDGGGLSAQHMLPDGDGNTPAEMARLEGYTELGSWLEAENVRLLRADKLASVNADFEAEHTALELDSQGRTTVHHAAKAGSTDMLSRVPMSELQRVDRFGRAAVHYAAQAGNSVDSDGEAAAALAVCCRRLDNEEAAILAADKAGCTVLHYAAMQPTSCFVKVLLSTSCPVYMKLLVAQDRGGKTGMHYAAERGSASSIELMIACLQQCRNGTATSSASALIQTDRAGRTPLHFSAHRGKKGESVVLACLSDAAGVASTTMADRSGKTPLHLLAEHSTASSVQTCLAAMVANEVQDGAEQLAEQLAHAALRKVLARARQSLHLGLQVASIAQWHHHESGACGNILWVEIVTREPLRCRNVVEHVEDADDVWVTWEARHIAEKLVLGGKLFAQVAGLVAEEVDHYLQCQLAPFRRRRAARAHRIDVRADAMHCEGRSHSTGRHVLAADLALDDEVFEQAASEGRRKRVRIHGGKVQGRSGRDFYSTSSVPRELRLHGFVSFHLPRCPPDVRYPGLSLFLCTPCHDALVCTSPLLHAGFSNYTIWRLFRRIELAESREGRRVEGGDCVLTRTGWLRSQSSAE
eukprot:COSAG02_NODE_3073_length_7423_cov_10.177635_3_plen_1005_part_00